MSNAGQTRLGAALRPPDRGRRAPARAVILAAAAAPGNPGLSPQPRPAKARKVRRSDEKLRALVAAAGLAVILGLGIFFGSLSQAPKTPPAVAIGEAGRPSGSIVFVAREGSRCRQGFIDNETWRFHATAYVDCDTAMSQVTDGQRQKWSAERVEAIRSGISKR